MHDVNGTRPERRREGRKSRSQILQERSDGACGYCGKILDKSTTTRDHIIPRARGGRTQTDNLMLCCITCNNQKRDLDLEDFRAERFNGSAFWFEILAMRRNDR